MQTMFIFEYFHNTLPAINYQFVSPTMVELSQSYLNCINNKSAIDFDIQIELILGSIKLWVSLISG